MTAQATNDGRMGMLWWNACSKDTRARWLAASGSAVPAQAWECFKRSSDRPEVTTNQFTTTAQTQAATMLATIGDTP